MIELINTIEINPLKYSKEDFKLPEIADYPDPEEYFLKFMETASHLALNFNEIQKGSNLVNIENIDDESLETIVVAKLTEVEFDDPDEKGFVLSFDGGIVLKKDDEILIEPSCCGDLSNIENWQKIFEGPSSEWKDLWIGHPWVLYKRENDKVSFSEYTESNEIDPEKVKILFEVEESELKAEVEKAVQHQVNFKNRVLAAMKKIYIENPERIAELLTGIG